MRFKNNEFELAGTGRRFVALLVDGLLLSVVGAVLTPGNIAEIGPNGVPDRSSALSLLFAFLYYWYFWTRSGQTPGQRMVGVRVIRLDGELMTGADALVRYLVRLISAVFFLLGFLWAFSDRLNQTWHDKAAGTLVVREGTVVVLD